MNRMPVCSRLKDLIRFYDALDGLEAKTGGRRLLATCNSRMSWPARGVYFFMEEGENRSGSGTGSRVVRVGTHALTAGSRTTLWKRLSQHKGTEKTGGGNHRGSIFRLIVGTALDQNHPTWGRGRTVSGKERAHEQALEQKVSQTIRAMPFLWLPVDDGPGIESLRGFIERNAIALLSHSGKPEIDAPSGAWLGHLCARERVRASGLWNQNHVNEHCEPEFLNVLERLVENI